MVKYSVLRKSDSGADERLGSTGGRLPYKKEQIRV